MQEKKFQFKENKVSNTLVVEKGTLTKGSELKLASATM